MKHPCHFPQFDEFGARVTLHVTVCVTPALDNRTMQLQLETEVEG